MGKYFLVGWLPGLEQWFARQTGGYYITDESLDNVLREVKTCRLPVRIDSMLDAKSTLQVIGACAFLEIKVVDENGQVLKPTPVSEATVKYITRKELGNLIPDGWMIECQLNTYAACYGEQISFPARKSVRLAIADIRHWLATTVAESAADLAASVASEPGFEQAVMDLGLVSTDRRDSAAVDKVHRS